ncbi:2-dehydro-3-deoxygalactonokinase [Spirosoma areae]
MTTYLLCCDWGTSFLRLKLMTTSDWQCVDEVLSRQGIAGTFDAWKKTGEQKGITRNEFFRRQLKTPIDQLANNLSLSLAGVPVIISGMASSSIGMEEIPYAGLPFAVDGSQASLRRLDAQADFPHELILISGVSSERDVMRGEETQLIGLMALLTQSGDKPAEAVCVFPGTHSKHMYVQDGQLINIETYMTGELFDLLASQSILKDSVDLRGLSDMSDAAIQAFKLGVGQVKFCTILNSLFAVRTNQLFDKLTKKQNAFYLSGLLIGTELNPLIEQEKWPIILCSGSRLAAFYKMAIDELHLTPRTTIISADLIDKTAGVGQLILFQNQAIKEAVR